MRRTDPLYLLLFVLFGAGLITGMFFDLEISSIGCGGFAVYTGSIGLRARKRTSED